MVSHGNIRQLFKNMNIAMYRCVVSRSFSSSCHLRAGFQGFQGQNYSLEQRQNVMERKKRLIKKLQNAPLELKPIKDYFIRYSWKLPERSRDAPILTGEELERRILLQKEWAKYLAHRKREDDEKMSRLMQSQEQALYELRQESQDLYNAALQLDETLFPFTQDGPSETPPMNDYKAPLGSCTKWEDTFD